MISPQLKELLLQSLVHERGGVLVYRTALECVQNDELRDEWKKYLAQTVRHVELLTTASQTLGLDPGSRRAEFNGSSPLYATLGRNVAFMFGVMGVTMVLGAALGRLGMHVGTVFPLFLVPLILALAHARQRP